MSTAFRAGDPSARQRLIDLGPSAVPYLLLADGFDGNTPKRDRVLAAIAAAVPNLPTFRERLASDDPQAQLVAIREIGGFGEAGAAALPALRAAMREHLPLRSAVIETVGRFGRSTIASLRVV